MRVQESEEEGEKTSLGGAFASLTGTVSASAVPTGKPAPAPELAPKLTKLIDKLTSYKQRLEAVRATNAAQTATITKLKAEVRSMPLM